MPRLSQIRTTPIGDLAGQLRFAPRATVMKQIERARALGREIDPDSVYDEAWVIERITGYRPEERGGTMLVGEALLGDLSSLIERLCSGVRLRLDQIGEPLLTPDELAGRWGVSRRTIERYRRRGLMALRGLDERGRARIVITEHAATAFETANRGLIQAGGSFERIPPALRSRVLARVERYQRVRGLSRNSAIERVARRYGRSREAIRLILEREGHLSPRAGAPDARDRESMWQAWRRGAEVRDLAGMHGIAPAAVHRMLCEQRARRLRRLELHARDSAGRDEATLALLEHPALQSDLTAGMHLDAHAFVTAAQHDSPTPAGIERTLSTGFALLIARAAHGIEHLHPHSPRARALDRIETDLRWAGLVKIRLLLSLRGLMLRTIEERLERPLLTLTPEQINRIHDLMVRAASDAIGAFDPARGGRLAAPVSLALARTLAGAHLPGDSAEHRRARARAAPLHEWTSDLDPPFAAFELSSDLVRRAAALEVEMRRVLELRYGLVGRRPRTIDESAHELGLGRGRVLRLERAAIATLHA